jgi:hypothetical protein
MGCAICCLPDKQTAIRPVSTLAARRATADWRTAEDLPARMRREIEQFFIAVAV